MSTTAPTSLNGAADAAAANSLLPEGAGFRFTVRDVVDLNGTTIASAPVPDGWATDDISGFTFAAPAADPTTGSVTGLVIGNDCYGQCTAQDWSSVLRAPGELIERRLAAGATERPVDGSQGVILRWVEPGSAKVEVLRWADDSALLFSCLAVVADADAALLDALEAACVAALPSHIAVG